MSDDDIVLVLMVLCRGLLNSSKNMAKLERQTLLLHNM